jgi:protein-tyrosine phosphatase
VLHKRLTNSMPLYFQWDGGWYRFDIDGGPFDARPVGGTFNVCVRSERVPFEGVHAWLPIKDFQVPQDTSAVVSVLKKALRAMLDGKKVYVGCMGGIGRTGLFLALLAKVAGIGNPVGYVRWHYDDRSCETEEQIDYVAAFPVEEIQRWFFWAAWRKRFGWFLGLS